MSDTTFIDGLRAFTKHEKAPDFVICNVSIDPGQLILTLQEWQKANPGQQYMKSQLLISREGQPYFKRDDYKPQGTTPPTFQQPAQTQPSITPEPEDDIPF